MSAGRGPKLLYFLRGEGPPTKPMFAVPLEALGWQVDCVVVSENGPVRGVISVLRARHDFSAYDVVAASEYFLVWAVGLRLLLTRAKSKGVALSFNQSSKRLVRTGFRPVDWLLNRIWRRITLFHVHSRAEARLFAKLHDIPADRFMFSHWGYDLPQFEPRRSGSSEKPYVTMVGRNNRDLATFCSAVEKAGVGGVLITAGYMVERHPIEPRKDIQVLVDRPVEECLNYVEGSFAHLVLVTDAERGAGHISAVSAMLLGKAQIFSDVAPLADYLTDGFNGIAVPVGDVDAVAEAIRKLLRDPELRDRLGSAGKEFALETMSNSASAAGISKVLIAAVEESASPV